MVAEVSTTDDENVPLSELKAHYKERNEETNKTGKKSGFELKVGLSFNGFYNYCTLWG